MPTYGLYLSTLVHEFIGIYVRKLSNYYTKTGLEAGTGRGIHHYTIHNYVGRAMNIGKKSPDGKYSVQDLTLINKKASELKDYYKEPLANSTIIN